jgi:PAS domain S-box-containing protein
MLPLAAVVRAYARSERELARTAAIVAFSDDAIIGKTLDGVITSWNAGAARLYGYEAGEVIGRSISTIIPRETGDEFSKILAQVRQGQPVDNYETLRVAKDGRRVHVSVTVSPVRDPNGRIVGASSIARDVTHRKQIEAATRERDTLRSLASLAAAAAHEINNPLAVVMGQTQMLAGEVAASGRVRIAEILEAVTRINTIVARMMHLNRIEMLRGSPALPEMLDIRKSSEPDISGGSDAVVAGLAIGSWSLIVVAQDQRARCEHLQEMFAAESVEVILDRRAGERRRSQVAPKIERRLQQRRRNDITPDLKLRGWAMVNR